MWLGNFPSVHNAALASIIYLIWATQGFNQLFGFAIVVWVIISYGLFEDKKGQTELYIAGKTTSGNIPVTRYYLLNASFNFFNVVQKNKANPKNITFKLDGKPTNSEIDAIDWTYLASLKLADYENKTHNKMYAKGNQKSVSVYIKDIIIPKTYFIRWLIKLKYPLPKRWYEKN